MDLQANMKREAEAIEAYQEMLNCLDKFDKEDTYAQGLINQVEEFISDELNHQENLMRLYVEITGIGVAED